MNNITIVGNVGKDPESYEGKSLVCKFSVATKEFNNVTMWHNITCFGKTAEFVKNYIRKGSTVAVSGSYLMDEYTDKDGNKRYNYYINAPRVEGVGSKPQQDNNQQQVSGGW